DRVDVQPVDSGTLTRVVLPPDADSRFGWLVVDRNSAATAGTFQMADEPSLQSNHLITWRSLERSPSAQAIKLDSCAQWHGFGSVAYVRVPPGAEVSMLRLAA